jgi:hypothetical protein
MASIGGASILLQPGSGFGTMRSVNVPSKRPILMALPVLALALRPIAVLSQNPQLNSKNGRRFPTIVFYWVQWRAQPSYYSIAIDSTGASTYQSAPISDERNGVPYTMEFQASDRTLRTTFNLARRLEFFTQALDLQLTSPANSAVQTLAFEDGETRHQITYSASADADVQELTSVFEEISETLEFGRRLAYSRQHEPARLRAELGDLENKAKRHLLRELQALEPVLRSIASDTTLEAGARQRARQLIERLDHPSSM